MAIGHIKVDRALQDHWLFRRNDPVTIGEAWVLLLMWANYKDDSENINGTIVQCLRGQIIFSLDTYATRFRWEKSKVRRFFEKLKNNDMIVIEGLKNTTRVTICNYEHYQGDRHSNDTLATLSRHSRDTLATPSKEDNKEISKETSIREASLFGNEQIEHPVKNDKPKRSTPKKHKPEIKKEVFGDEFKNVFLTTEEFGKLVAKYTEPITVMAIDIYSIWKEGKGARHKSDYLAMLKGWPFERAVERMEKLSPSKMSASDAAISRSKAKMTEEQKRMYELQAEYTKKT